MASLEEKLAARKYYKPRSIKETETFYCQQANILGVTRRDGHHQAAACVCVLRRTPNSKQLLVQKYVVQDHRTKKTTTRTRCGPAVPTPVVVLCDLSTLPSNFCHSHRGDSQGVCTLTVFCLQTLVFLLTVCFMARSPWQQQH